MKKIKICPLSLDSDSGDLPSWSSDKDVCTRVDSPSDCKPSEYFTYKKLPQFYNPMPFCCGPEGHDPFPAGEKEKNVKPETIGVPASSFRTITSPLPAPANAISNAAAASSHSSASSAPSLSSTDSACHPSLNCYSCESDEYCRVKETTKEDGTMQLKTSCCKREQKTTATATTTMTPGTAAINTKEMQQQQVIDTREEAKQGGNSQADVNQQVVDPASEIENLDEEGVIDPIEDPSKVKQINAPYSIAFVSPSPSPASIFSIEWPLGADPAHDICLSIESCDTDCEATETRYCYQKRTEKEGQGKIESLCCEHEVEEEEETEEGATGAEDTAHVMNALEDANQERDKNETNAAGGLIASDADEEDDAKENSNVAGAKAEGDRADGSPLLSSLLIPTDPAHPFDQAGNEQTTVSTDLEAVFDALKVELVDNIADANADADAADADAAAADDSVFASPSTLETPSTPFAAPTPTTPTTTASEPEPQQLSDQQQQREQQHQTELPLGASIEALAEAEPAAKPEAEAAEAAELIDIDRDASLSDKPSLLPRPSFQLDEEELSQQSLKRQEELRKKIEADLSLLEVQIPAIPSPPVRPLDSSLAAPSSLDSTPLSPSSPSSLDLSVSASSSSLAADSLHWKRVSESSSSSHSSRGLWLFVAVLAFVVFVGVKGKRICSGEEDKDVLGGGGGGGGGGAETGVMGSLLGAMNGGGNARGEREKEQKKKAGIVSVVLDTHDSEEEWEANKARLSAKNIESRGMSLAVKPKRKE